MITEQGRKREAEDSKPGRQDSGKYGRIEQLGGETFITSLAFPPKRGNSIAIKKVMQWVRTQIIGLSRFKT